MARSSPTREAVRALLAEGRSYTEIARELGLSKPTICHHARALGFQADQRFSRRYDWAEIQRYYDAGHSVIECQEQFGFAKASWNKAVERGDVVPRPHAMPLQVLLTRGQRRSRHNIKLRLISAGVKAEACEECELAEWRGMPIPLELHHVNGDRHDNRLKNLQLLCPNCHALTENFGVRNRAA
jgi:hypothetical protein